MTHSSKHGGLTDTGRTLADPSPQYLSSQYTTLISQCTVTDQSEQHRGISRGGRGTWTVCNTGTGRAQSSVVTRRECCVPGVQAPRRDAWPPVCTVCIHGPAATFPLPAIQPDPDLVPTAILKVQVLCFRMCLR